MSHQFNTIRFFPDQPPQVIGESKFSHLLHETPPMSKTSNLFGDLEHKIGTELSDEEGQQD